MLEILHVVAYEPDTAPRNETKEKENGGRKGKKNKNKK